MSRLALEKGTHMEIEIGMKVKDSDGDIATVTGKDKLGRLEIEYQDGQIGVVYSDEVKPAE